MNVAVGMAVYDDFCGVYFTLQALRLYHPPVELIVVDNRGDDRLRDWIAHWIPGARYIRATETIGTSYPRDRVFREAKSDWVLCVDSHVMLMPGAIEKFISWTTANPDCLDLLQGPMVYDNLVGCETHMDPKWRAQMFGTWAGAEALDSLPNEPFEIPMHGLGLFGCRRDAWLGFNANCRGFGGEEGYIHEKYRRAGQKTLCLPFLGWIHLYESKRNYPLDLQDRVRNYVAEWDELGMDNTEITNHFGKRMVQCACSS